MSEIQWVSLTVWWKPWTWGSGYWETPEGYRLQDWLAKRTEGGDE